MSGAPSFDFGYRAGYAQLGSYRKQDGLAFVYAPWGNCDAPAPGTVFAWIAAATPYTAVRMIAAYEPVYVRNFPTRAMVAGGDECSFPSIEADALVTAGIASYA